MSHRHAYSVHYYNDHRSTYAIIISLSYYIRVHNIYYARCSPLLHIYTFALRSVPKVGNTPTAIIITVMLLLLLLCYFAPETRCTRTYPLTGV